MQEQRGLQTNKPVLAISVILAIGVIVAVPDNGVIGPFVISTGLTGFAFGSVYVIHRYNLWHSVFTHGFSNTFGILAIDLNLDRHLDMFLWD